MHFNAPVFHKEWKARFDEETKETIEKSHFVIKCDIQAIFPIDMGRSYTATGSASTNDPFFMRGGKSPHPLNVDEEDVRKKAETNARARALIGLGIANFTPDELSQAGLDTSKSTSHEYKTGAPKSEPTEKQFELLDKLIGQKLSGHPSDAELQKWFRTQGLTKNQLAGIIDWMIQYQDGAMDYEGNFQKDYEKAKAGAFKKEKGDK